MGRLPSSQRWTCRSPPVTVSPRNMHWAICTGSSSQRERENTLGVSPSFIDDLQRCEQSSGNTQGRMRPSGAGKNGKQPSNWSHKGAKWGWGGTLPGLPLELRHRWRNAAAPAKPSTELTRAINTDLTSPPPMYSGTTHWLIPTRSQAREPG